MGWRFFYILFFVVLGCWRKRDSLALGLEIWVA